MWLRQRPVVTGRQHSGQFFSFVFFPKERLSLSMAAPAGLITRLPGPLPGRPGGHGWVPGQDPQLVRPPAAPRPVFSPCLREARPPVDSGAAPPKCAAVPHAWQGRFFGLVLHMVGELRKVKRKEPPSGPPPSTSHLFVSAPEDLNPDLVLRLN